MVQFHVKITPCNDEDDGIVRRWRRFLPTPPPTGEGEQFFHAAAESVNCRDLLVVVVVAVVVAVVVVVVVLGGGVSS